MARVTCFLVILLIVASTFSCRPGSGSLVRVPSFDAERQRLASRLLEKIPPDSSLSIQSDLMAYLGPKGSPYLFPVVNNAEYILADVTVSDDPEVARGLRDKVQDLLGSGQYGVLDAADGLALLQRGLVGHSQLPDSFYEFLRVQPDQTGLTLHARFGDDLELVAYDYQTSEGRLAKVSTYWRALRPLEGEDFRVVFYLTPLIGEQPEPYEDGSMEELWYPPSRWQSGELIKLEFAPQMISRDTSTVQVMAYLQDQQGRASLPATLPGGIKTEGAVRVLDLTASPGERVSLDAFIGLPFEGPPAPKKTTAAPAPSPPVAFSLCHKPLDDASLALLRPVAIKVDNAPAARPQAGLDQACVVYEHLAEGGVTRLTAIYQTEEADVGPVRSARRVDLQIVPQFQALFGHVGGAPAEMALIKQQHLLDVDQFFHSDAYYFSKQRYAPQNVFTSVSAIRSKGEALGYGREAALEGFPFSETPPQDGTPATDIIIPYLTSSRGEFRYDAETGDYIRLTGGQPHTEAGTGQAVRTKNVIVQRVKSWVVSYTEDANGAASLDFDLLGQGKATVFRDGLAIDGIWKRSSLGDWTRFYDNAARIIPLAPGMIWISLVSPDDQIQVK
ncbi:MAG: DUF3048 domain-containing protein [Dehalococcoidia bacterium]|nr:DUF3048 domain-containing protein [Dehalococcoidia bacterium]